MEKDITQILKDSKERSEALNESIKALLIYVGFASATISAIAYIIITIVMVRGFTTDFDIANQIVFSILGALIGLSISTSLRIQGIAFAKRDEHAQEVMKAYNKAINKVKEEKELHDINYHFKRATLFDVLVKGTIFIVSTFFVLYIFIEGNGNWSLVGLALANIFMFIGFGLIALASIYDKYLEEHIPVIEELTSKINNKKEEKEKALD